MPTDSSMIYLKLKSHNSALVIGRCLVLIKMFPLKKNKYFSTFIYPYFSQYITAVRKDCEGTKNNQ